MENIFGPLLAICFSIAYIPQIIKIIKYKSSNDVSLLMLLINAIGYLSGLLYCIFTSVEGFWLFFNYTSGLIMTILVMVLWKIYLKKEG